MPDDRIEAALKEEARHNKNRSSLFKQLAEGQLSTPAAWYAVLERYYENNGLYDALAQLLRVSGLWMQGMKPLRNPAHRAVEFHVSHLWPGALPKALPITAKKTSVTEAIVQVWDWSNWGVEKQLTARNYANLGDLFVKVPTHRGVEGTVTQVFLQVLNAANVIDFKKDARGFLTWIRIDTFQMRTNEEGSEQMVRTEIWNKAENSYKIYEHTKGKGAAINQLGDPTTNKPIKESFGFDFIPIVHAKFCDVGTIRGTNCYFHALDKIDEANMMATRLHQLLFRYNKPTTVVMANSEDESGRPLPPPAISDRNQEMDETAAAVLGDEDLWELPGYSKVEHLVPNIKYADALAILQAQVAELEADLPEMLYYELKDKGDASGKALQTILSGAIDRVLEARGNAESALVRAQQMALTIGQLRQLPGFDASAIGTFEDGGFDHSFKERPVIPLSAKEVAETVKLEVDAGMPLVFSMRRQGFDQPQLDQMQTDLQQQRDNENELFGNLVLDSIRNRDQGTDLPVAGAGKSLPGGESSVADTAMNGAQVASLVTIITQVTLGQLAPEAAIELIKSAFPSLDEDNIKKMIDAAVSFEPTSPPPVKPTTTVPQTGPVK